MRERHPKFDAMIDKAEAKSEEWGRRTEVKIREWWDTLAALVRR